MSQPDLNNVIIDLNDLKGWTPYEGLGSNDHIKAGDGLFKFVVQKIVGQISEGEKTKGAPMIAVAIDILDQDAHGAHLVKTVMCGGRDKNGEPLCRQLGDFLASIAPSLSPGITPEQVKVWVTQKIAAMGQQRFGDFVASVLRPFEGKAQGHAEIVTGFYQNQARSEVQNFIDPSRYEKAVAANTHRHEHKKAPQFAGPPAGFVPQPGAVLPGTLPTQTIATLPGVPVPTAPNGAGAPVIGPDPLDTVRGLQVPSRI